MSAMSLFIVILQQRMRLLLQEGRALPLYVISLCPCEAQNMNQIAEWAKECNCYLGHKLIPSELTKLWSQKV